MQQKLTQLKEETLAKIKTLATEQEIIDYRNAIVGKSGSLTEILKGIKDLSVEDKQTIGKLSNDIKVSILEAFELRLNEIKKAEIEAKLANEFFDVTSPSNEDNAVHKHPLTRALDQIYNTFERMGFKIYESAEVSTEYLNFDSLNVPATHPARDMQDTFWLEGKGNVLATQTSSMQNIIYKSSELPIRAIVPGRVFRNEDIDATHENTFYQVEGVVVDKDINIGHLKYTIKTMLGDLFGKEVEIRLRPGFFPFVEPGVEIDFSCPFCIDDGSKCRVCKGSSWIEFMGAGLIHPNVLREGGIDPEVYSGFAFGFGLNRLVMIKYGINDIRYFQQPNLAFLKQF
ncbi:MAG: phenylalanine--tRNA ligase subunit alpha [Candidatus Gracilibacteria bacterium]|nr:phenylalanine--tRNA ligase subunit alpha [Candidatus Gracilibacteria bacterium]MDD2908698.1 phenylalanine--tRNA ligase subunit alpha [Candidatus Gracilibacteria bacterium]